MTFDEFKDRVDQEGLEYTVCNFYNPEDLATLENEELRDAVLKVAELTNFIMCDKLDLW